MLPTFFSDRAQFTVTFPNMFLAWQETHPDIEVNFVENEGDTQDVSQGEDEPTIKVSIIKNPVQRFHAVREKNREP